ncbi:MAG: DNA-binding response regulator [Bacteroidetes bacterium]|nr:MAG: DNA-binding response regulator [Bacteroidota bacterium]
MMMKIKCVIVDDEELARQLLAEYLGEYDNIEIVAECGSGRDAIRKIDELGADLVFLDVQMPGIDGFDVLENIESDPFVIFCTAYDKYAIKAFEKNTIDYLLKPLDKDRFDQAISRATERISNNESNFMHILEDLNSKDVPGFSNNIFVQKSEKLVNLPVQNIIHLEASKDYTIISTKSEQFVSSTGISKLEEKLDPEIFIRIHRSTIINLQKLTEIEKFGSGNLAAHMENGKTFPISRSYAKSIRDRIV